MPKFNKTVDELETRFEKWLYVLRNLNRTDKVPEKLKERIFEKLFEVAEIAKFNRKQILSYEDSLKYYRDMKNSLDTAHEEGKIEGKIEEKIEIAKKMFADSEPIEKIHRYTGLTIEQINNIGNH